jgi:hypothetical protein
MSAQVTSSVIALVLSLGQSINIEVGPAGQTPTSSYGAAGLPGVWNVMNTTPHAWTFNLLDVNGNVTAAQIKQYGGTELRVTDDAGTSGEDDALLDDCLVTYTPSLETCYFVYYLELGVYEVIVYAWMPNRPDVLSYTSSDEEPGYPHKFVGGAWPGQHQQGVTYSRHICYVTNPTFGLLRVHSGIAPGENAADGAAANGLQIRRLPAQSLGDMNCDGSVNGRDIAGFVQAITDTESYSLRNPTCNITNADMNEDHFQDAADVGEFIDAVLGV